MQKTTRRLFLGGTLALGAGLFLEACSRRVEPTPISTRIDVPPSSPMPAGSTSLVATSAVQTALPACVVRPAQTEGPYFVDEKLNRSDIRSDPSDGSVKEGVPLKLTIRVAQMAGSSCSALPAAMVDVWHCDAPGAYSDVRDPGFSTAGKKFLRGYQVTDASGAAIFTTIYPGWYQGRAVHIHFKIRTASGQEFTSQLYFDDALSDQVFTQAPYASRGVRSTRNDNDGVFRNGGSQLVLRTVKDGAGYAATFDIGLQTT